MCAFSSYSDISALAIWEREIFTTDRPATAACRASNCAGLPRISILGSVRLPADSCLLHCRPRLLPIVPCLGVLSAPWLRVLTCSLPATPRLRILSAPGLGVLTACLTVGPHLRVLVRCLPVAPCLRVLTRCLAISPGLRVGCLAIAPGLRVCSLAISPGLRFGCLPISPWLRVCSLPNTPDLRVLASCLACGQRSLAVAICSLP